MLEHNKTDLFLSCDWGTSSFRLKLFDAHAETSIAEYKSDMGCAVLFTEWQKKGTHITLETYYLQYLKKAVSSLSSKSGMELSHLDITISGMASSSIGMRELPYAPLPFAADGNDAGTIWISDKKIIDNDILLISGITTSDDVMRGEETQLIGVVQRTEEKSSSDNIYIFPGTHSKHITVKDQKIVDFKTFMTGELFSIFLKHGLLAGSVSVPEDDKMDEAEMKAFQAGLGKAAQGNLLHHLFSVRVNALKKYYPHVQNYFYLSGLLIGAELADGLTRSEAYYTICADQKLGNLYYAALQFFGFGEHTSLLTDRLSGNAAATGQSIILQKNKKKNKPI